MHSSDILRLCLTMDYKQRPDTAFLLRNPALASRARSLCIELDPDAKNESQRPIASFITSANIIDSNAIELYDPAEGREAILSKKDGTAASCRNGTYHLSFSTLMGASGQPTSSAANSLFGIFKDRIAACTLSRRSSDRTRRCGRRCRLS